MDSSSHKSSARKVYEKPASKRKKNGASDKSATVKSQTPEWSGRGLKRQKRMRFQPESVKFNKKDEPHKEYYKELLEGDSKSEIEMPRAVCVADLVESSAAEMKAMLHAVSQHTSNRAVLQKIPRHMRRRAASHSKKRLPRRLHQLAEEMSANAQADSGEKAKKPLCRKKRRRKPDLQNEYSKRAGKSGWLETHIWHAKRFHMSESNDPKFSKWGNRVALFPNDKSFRACHRAVAKHCLIQDISYMRCLCLSGTKEVLADLLKDACNQDFDLSALSGRREENVMIYDVKGRDVGGGNIMECIGPASVLWKSNSIRTEQSDVLMWIHPVILSSTLKVLTSCCERNSLKVHIHDISDNLLRFRLTGPKSSVTLLSVLRPMNEIAAADDENNDLAEWMLENKNKVSRLHDEFVTFATDCHRQTFARPESAVSHNELPEFSDGSIFPVITNDPRLILPLDKTTPTLTKARSNLEVRVAGKGDEIQVAEGETPCLSPIWIEEIRKQISRSRKPDHVVSTRKHEQKYSVSEEDKEIWRRTLSTAVPVIAIRKVPNENTKLDMSEVTVKTPHSGPDKLFAAGWDLILPKSWATAFWVPLIYSRARAGGLREKRNTNLEHLKPHFPEDFPDTVAGRDYWTAEANSTAAKHYKRPPAKRPNYSVLAVPHPFRPEWMRLFSHPMMKEGAVKSSEQSSGDEPPSKMPKLDVESTKNVPVLRDHHKLVSLQQWIRQLADTSSSVVMSTLEIEDLKISRDHLICVGVHTLSKGIPFSRAMICAVKSEDIENLCEELTDPYKYGLQSVTGPEEEKHSDPHRKDRREARKQAKKNKKKKILVSEQVPGFQDGEKCDSSLLPKKPQCFPVHPAREIIGYVTSGDFVFSYACGAGIGFVAFEKLHTLATRQTENENLKAVLADQASRTALLNGTVNVPLLALMRNVNSTQYRFVRLEIIKPS